MITPDGSMGIAEQNAAGPDHVGGCNACHIRAPGRVPVRFVPSPPEGVAHLRDVLGPKFLNASIPKGQ
jgi:hypothetical protein